jgi:hypothetical protein
MGLGGPWAVPRLVSRRSGADGHSGPAPGQSRHGAIRADCWPRRASPRSTRLTSRRNGPAPPAGGSMAGPPTRPSSSSSIRRTPSPNANGSAAYNCVPSRSASSGGASSPRRARQGRLASRAMLAACVPLHRQASLSAPGDPTRRSAHHPPVERLLLLLYAHEVDASRSAAVANTPIKAQATAALRRTATRSARKGPLR